MRTKSKMEGVYTEPWQSQAMSVNNLWCKGILHTGWATHFCLSFDMNKDIHVVSIDIHSPYRVSYEDHQDFFNKYFESDMSLEERKKNVPSFCRTWKLWGTLFLKEMDEGHFLSHYAREKNKNLFQYLVITQNEYIEFYTESLPRWETFKDSNLVSILEHYLKIDPKHEWWKSEKSE